MSNAYVYGALVMYAVIHYTARALPFLVLQGKELPAWLEHLSDNLPGSIMAILVVYNLRGTSFFTYPYAIPEIAAVLVSIISYHLRGSMVLTLVLGTFVYTLLLAIL